MEKGNSNLEGILILIGLIGVMIVMTLGKAADTNNSVSTAKGIKNTPSQNTTTSNSPDSINITLGTGNASYAYQSYEEYITIDSRSKNPINITNWYLKNGKDKRAYNIGGGEPRYFSSDIVTIGKGALFISPSGNTLLQNIVLGQYEKAILTTGSMGSQTPYKIVSFKENICSGYLENMDEYNFTPPLTRDCPRPANEPGITSLDTECRKFVERLPSCQEPEFETRDRNGDICRNCVNGKALSNACITFIKNHFSYNACIANHVNDANFSGKTWRIFLNHGWEMWAKEYETIELFDQSGKLIKSRTY